mmetsp:Transcript_18207/g.70384  ORF Transcript_18207/g.70384 Transcript_18207/m.70384 type:complete len:279 (-) Transcript_18207:366-1202(-)
MPSYSRAPRMARKRRTSSSSQRLGCLRPMGRPLKSSWRRASWPRMACLSSSLDMPQEISVSGVASISWRMLWRWRRFACAHFSSGQSLIHRLQFDVDHVLGFAERNSKRDLNDLPTGEGMPASRLPLLLDARAPAAAAFLLELALLRGTWSSPLLMSSRGGVEGEERVLSLPTACVAGSMSSGSSQSFSSLIAFMSRILAPSFATPSRSRSKLCILRRERPLTVEKCSCKSAMPFFRRNMATSAGCHFVGGISKSRFSSVGTPVATEDPTGWMSTLCS